MRRGKRSGFTLIELLVVIAIIAILAAILFPVFLTAKRAGQRSQCLSNVGQLSKAILTYAADYSGRIPSWRFAVGTTPIGFWDQAVYKYVKNKKIYTCPVNKLDSNGNRYPANVIVRSYALPKNISGEMVEQAPRPSATVLLFEKGSQPLFTESDATGEWFTQTYGYGHNPDTQPLASPSKYWHGPGKNFAFCDGHARYYRYPAGPFSYNFPNFIAWSTLAYPNNPGGPGYCGWANTIGAADPTDGSKVFTGANLPR